MPPRCALPDTTRDAPRGRSTAVSRLKFRRPGAYRSGDYARFGFGLAVLPLATIALLIPMIWPPQGQ